MNSASRELNKCIFSDMLFVRCGNRASGYPISASRNSQMRHGGGNTVMVKGGTKVMGHLMFGILALSTDQ